MILAGYIFVAIILVCVVTFGLVYISRLKKSHINQLVAARKQAIKKSTDIQAGFSIETVVPFMESFPYDPRDMQFFGMPIDYICFTGLHSSSKGGVQVRLIEIKKDTSKLNRNQIDIKNAIINGQVFFDEINISTKPDVPNTIKTYTPGKKRAKADAL